MSKCTTCKHSHKCSNQSPCHECTDGNKFEPKYKLESEPFIPSVQPLPPTSIKALDIQVGGNHYKDMAIQPAEYCHRNKLTWCESNVIKYVSRHTAKNGIEDLKKAIHYIKLLAKMDYNIEL